jgi:5-methylcytosine-specific restriction endonuclease McrA
VAARPLELRVPRPKLTAIGPDRVALQVVVSKDTRDKLEYAQALLAHQVRSGAVAEVLDRALDALITRLERGKFAASVRPQRRRRASTSRRHIPAHVRRAVVKRDEGRCTFLSESGKRCEARAMLEFDHCVPVARGGESSVENVRLCCRAHNQHAAERAFGAEFMRRKREQGRRPAPEQSRKAGAGTSVTAAAGEVIPYLCTLGFRAPEARALATHACECLPGAPLEERVRAALQASARKPQRRTLPAPAESPGRGVEHRLLAGS